MGADVVYQLLHPFHLWAQRAAICAVVLVVAAVFVLTLSRRWSRRWWLGMAVLALCLLTVAFGERSRSAAGDLRPLVAACHLRWMPACETWAAWLADAVGRVSLLGMAAVAAAVAGVVVAAGVVYAERRALAHGGWSSLAPARLLAPAVLWSALGAYLTADGVAAWRDNAYLADATGANAGIGQLPLIFGIFGTVVGGIVLAAGLTFAVAAAPSRSANRLHGGDYDERQGTTPHE